MKLSIPYDISMGNICPTQRAARFAVLLPSRIPVRPSASNANRWVLMYSYSKLLSMYAVSEGGLPISQKNCSHVA